MKKLFSLLFTVCLSAFAFSQGTLTGKVFDENGKPLSGAFIFEKGSMGGTISGADGSYSVNYKDTASVIVFNYVGYLKHQIVAERRTKYDAAMILANTLGTTEIVGTRRPGRTQTETAVGVDVIDVTKLTTSSGQIEVNQLLQNVAPSFNSNKQSGADGADHVDPATLRGLGPDQTLVLINGKRRHQSSSINIFGSRGRGNTGTDLNAIPLAAIDRIEILRDGASAQYGSDAIAGVINIVLKSGTGELNGNILTGANKSASPDDFKVVEQKNKYDGETWQFNGNQGVKLGKKGFANFTLDHSRKQGTSRVAAADSITYVYRNRFGDAASSNTAFFVNSGVNFDDSADVYFFGGINYRLTDAFAWSRDSMSERNVRSIYFHGFDPVIKSVITDKSFSAGSRSKMANGWNMDINNTYGSNRFHFIVDKTLNASLEDKSPTRFDAGGFSLTENSTSATFSKMFAGVLEGLNFAFGSELRANNYQIFAGEEASWKNYGAIFSIDTVTGDTTYRPGGSQGFPGFQPSNEVNETRTNLGMFADAELDITETLMLGAAMRFEDYSDFGSSMNWKVASRYKITNYISLRGAYSTGFRAPSLAQLYYNTTFTDFVAGQPVDKIIAKNNSNITRALGIPALKEETSSNLSYGFAIKYKSLSLTVDAYSITIKDRIVLTGAFYSDDPDIGAELQALNVGAAQFFTNAVNTKTSGADIVFGYTPLVSNEQVLRLNLAMNVNKMEITDVYTNDKLKGKEQTYFGLREKYFLLASAPKSKMTLNAEYTNKNIVVDARINMFGKVELMNWNDNGDTIASYTEDIPNGIYREVDVYGKKFTTDLSFSYNFKNVRLTLGGMNILNAYPDPQDPGLTETGGIWDAVQMGFGGAYYYTRIGFKF